MRDSIMRTRDDRIDRYARGELSAAEARELAQNSLDDPGLFEELTFSALAKTALTAPGAADLLKEPAAGAKVIRFRGKTRVRAALAAIAAAIALVALYSERSHPGRSGPERNPSPETAIASVLKPALPFSAKPGQPVLLASELQPEAAHPEAGAFRGAESDSRSPRPAGSIVSIEDGLANINLGTLDGLAKGSEVKIFRGPGSADPIGRLVVSTVFRERARGRIPAGQQIEAHDQVRVAAADYIGALLQQVDTLAVRGNSSAARMMAEKAVNQADSAGVPLPQKWQALERLAQLEFQAGLLPATEKHYEAAVESLAAQPAPAPLEEAKALNDLAAVRLLLGDYSGAQSVLSQALSLAPKPDRIHGQSANNLGVLAELQGQRSRAEALYSEALGAFSGRSDSVSSERRAVETNLARVR